MKRKTKISLIVAVDQKGVIGRDDELPWHLSTDLKNFKKVTMGKPIIMGRKTHESIGKPLPGRQNIIITRNKDFQADGCKVCHHFDDAIEMCENEEEVVVIGGSEIYRIALDFVNRIYLTEVHADVDGNIFLPVIDRVEWDEIIREDIPADDKNEYPFSMLILEKRHSLYW